MATATVPQFAIPVDATGSSGGQVFVQNSGAQGVVSALDGTTLVASINVGQYPGRQMAYAPTNGFLYLPNEGSGTVSVINSLTDKIVKTFKNFLHPTAA